MAKESKKHLALEKYNCEQRDWSIHISLVGESCNYLAQFLTQKYAESQPTKKRMKGVPFRVGSTLWIPHVWRYLL